MASKKLSNFFLKESGLPIYSDILGNALNRTRETAAFGCVSAQEIFFGWDRRKLPPSTAVKINLNYFFGVPLVPQVVLGLPQGHEDSEYVLSFEIGLSESVFYSGPTKPPSTVF